MITPGALHGWSNTEAMVKTATLRAGRQLYIEGTTIMYNRAFRVVVTAGKMTFPRRQFQGCHLNTETVCVKLEQNKTPKCMHQGDARSTREVWYVFYQPVSSHHFLIPPRINSTSLIK